MRGSDIRSPRDIGWLTNLTAGRMMRRDWVAVQAGTSVGNFRQSVPQGSVSKAVLVDEQGHYGGIVPMAAAHAPTLDAEAPIETVARLQDKALMPAMGIRAVLEALDEAGADELAVVSAEGQVLGVLSEQHARRRYLEEIEADQKRMFGEM